MSNILEWFSKKHSELVGNQDYDTLTKGMLPEEDEDMYYIADIVVPEGINLIFEDKKLNCITLNTPIIDETAITLLESQFPGVCKVNTRDEVITLLGNPVSEIKESKVLSRALDNWGGELFYSAGNGLKLSFTLASDEVSIRQLSIHQPK